MSRRVSTIQVVAVGLALAGVTRGQVIAERAERRLEQLRREQTILIDPLTAPQQRALIDGGAYVAASYLSLDDALGNNRVLRQYDGTLYARINLDGVHELFFRGIAGWRDFNDGDSFDGRGDERIDPDVERLFYRFDLQRGLSAYRGIESGPRLSLQIGRDLVDWGNSLVLSQTLDGVIVRYASEAIDVEAIAGVTPTRTVDFDSSRPAFDFNTKRGFYGVNVARQFDAHRPYAYVLVQRDYNTQDTFDLDLPQPPFTGDAAYQFDYDSFYLGGGSTGRLSDRLSYGVEVVFQGGRSRSDLPAPASPVDGSGAIVLIDPPEQSTDGISAAAADVRVDYLFDSPNRTRLTGELVLATGDSDRNHTSNTVGGNAAGTGDRAFNAFGLINTGLAFAPNVSNLALVRGGVSTFPITQGDALRRLQIGGDFLAFGKLNKNAPIDEPTDDDFYLGCEADVFLNWQITSDVTIAARYGAFFPSDAITSSDDVRQFLFVGVTYGL